MHLLRAKFYMKHSVVLHHTTVRHEFVTRPDALNSGDPGF